MDRDITNTAIRTEEELKLFLEVLVEMSGPATKETAGVDSIDSYNQRPVENDNHAYPGLSMPSMKIELKNRQGFEEFRRWYETGRFTGSKQLASVRPWVRLNLLNLSCRFWREQADLRHLNFALKLIDDLRPIALKPESEDIRESLKPHVRLVLKAVRQLHEDHDIT